MLLTGREQWGIKMAAYINRRGGQSKHRRTRRTRTAQAIYPTFRIDAPSPQSAGTALLAHQPAGYARYVGRVGALAMALGIGAAVATGLGGGESPWKCWRLLTLETRMQVCRKSSLLV